MDSYHRFFGFIDERYLVWYRREVLQFDPPWTADPILQRYKFTNVRREDDTVTRWIRTYVRERYVNHPNLWFLLCIARYINWPDTLQELIDKKVWPVRSWDATSFAQLLEDRKQRGDKVFTGAYMTKAAPENDTKSRWAAHVIDPLWQDRKDIKKYARSSIEDFVTRLSQYRDWGPFLCYQVAVDLSHTDWLRRAPDLNTYVTVGPGNKRGLNRIHDRPLQQSIPLKQAIREMVDLFIKQEQYLVMCPKLRLSDIQNCLCEFDKYERVRLKQGKPRGIYNARNKS